MKQKEKKKTKDRVETLDINELESYYNLSESMLVKAHNAVKANMKNFSQNDLNKIYNVRNKIEIEILKRLFKLEEEEPTA